MFKRLLALALTTIAVVVFAYTLIRATVYGPEDGDSGISTIPVYLLSDASSTDPGGVDIASTTISETVSSSSAVALISMPRTHLAIPSLGIDAVVQRVTVSSHDTIGVPTNFTDVGWYAYSPLPGKEGTSIIDGHVDNGLALAGVFKHLSDIKIGDSVSVTDPSGKVLNFQVIQIDTYPYESTSTDALSYPHPGSYLSLITCTGAWVPLHRTYDQRIVVTAKLVL